MNVDKRNRVEALRTDAHKLGLELIHMNEGAGIDLYIMQTHYQGEASHVRKFRSLGAVESFINLMRASGGIYGY